MFQKRRRNLANNLAKLGMQVALIDSPSNLYYYTGFTGGEAMFVMSVSENHAYIITDSRYYEQVEKECPDLTLIRMENKGFSEHVKELLEHMYQDGILYDTSIVDKKYSKVEAQPEKNAEKLSVNEKIFETDSFLSNIEYSCRVAVESSMNLEQYLKLCKTCPEVSFEIAKDAIMESRMVKDEEELQKLAKAEAIGDEAFTHILDFMKPGVTEKEVALELEFFMKRQGASKLSFDTIVASGSNSSMPHAQVTDRKIQSGDFVTMDFGCVYQGYCSDMTRTIAVGNPTEEMKKVYQIVLEANLRAMDGIREGIPCNEIDALARDYIKEQGYGDYFGHGLGHGVGLDIHEEPRFSPKCNIVTKENMVITDEPGIYLPGQFGVRIEDLVVVKKDGYEKLSHSAKELIII